MSEELINRDRGVIVCIGLPGGQAPSVSEGYQLLRFYDGGDQQRTCLQITTDGGYVQLTRKGAALLAADILQHFLEIPGTEDVKEVLSRAVRLFDEALPKFDWGRSALDANAIQLLNEVPGEVERMLKRLGEETEGDTEPDVDLIQKYLDLGRKV